MRKHLETLTAIKSDIMSETPQFAYPDNPRKKLIKDGTKNAVQALTIKMREFEQALETLNTELDEILEQEASSPRSPTRPASPLTLQMFKPISQSEAPSSEVTRIKQSIAVINNKIDVMFAESQKVFLTQVPELKPIYAVIYADKNVFYNQSFIYKSKSIEAFLAKNPDNSDYETLRKLHAEVSEIRTTLEELKKNPKDNAELIISNANQHIQATTQLNAEWSRLAKTLKEKMGGIDILALPMDMDQPKSSKISSPKN